MSRLARIAVFFAVALTPAVAWGADLDIRPVRIHLSASQRNGVLALANRGTESVRYQVTAEAWSQAADGQMVLTPTRDLVFFPSLVVIAPGETRRVRIAAPAASAVDESTYRILLTPLAEAAVPGAGTVAVLTRFSVPVFVQPRAPAPAPSATLRVEGGRVVVSVANRGNSYFVSRAVHVVGRSASGATLLEHTLPGWYVLARGERVYEIPLPAELCGSIAEIVATVTTEASSATATLARGSLRCIE